MGSFQYHTSWIDLEKKLESTLEKTLGEVDIAKPQWTRFCGRKVTKGQLSAP